MDSQILKRISVKITISNHSGKVVSVGSGVIIKDIDKFYVVTAAHCILGKNLEFKEFIKNIGIQREIEVTGDLENVQFESIIDYNEVDDWAILKLDNSFNPNNFPEIKRCDISTTKNIIEFRGFPKSYNNFRTFEGKVIDTKFSDLRITLIDKTFSQGFSSGSDEAKGLSGSGVIIIEDNVVYLFGTLKEVIGDNASFSDLVCCPIRLLDKYFSSSAIDFASISDGKESIQTKMPQFLTSIPMLLNPTLVGREIEINQLHHLCVVENARVAICGIKGIGKTTIIREFLSKSLNTYNFIAWFDLVNANSDFDQLILGQIRIQDDSFLSSLSFRPLTIDDVISYLASLLGHKILVFENITSQHLVKIDQLAKKLLGWKIIVSSHISLSLLSGFEKQNVIRLSPNLARSLFLSKYYHPNIEKVDEILRKIGYHTLTIEIIAKTCKFWGEKYPLDELLENIIKSGLQDLTDFTADINIDHSQQLVEGLLPYYDIIFDFGSLTEKYEKDVLINLSVLLPNKWSLDFISEIIDLSTDRKEILLYRKSLTKMNNLGLVFLDGDEVEMHETLQYFVRYKLQPDSNKCNTLIAKIQNELIFHHHHIPVRSLDILPHAENIISVINEKNSEKMAAFELTVAKSFQTLSLYDKAMLHLNNVRSKNGLLLNGKDNLQLKAYYNYERGRLYKHMNLPKSFEKGLKSFKKALHVIIQIYGIKNEEVANCYGEIGYLHLKNKDLKYAELYFQKAFRIHNLNPTQNRKNIALYYSNLGDIQQEKKQYDLGIDYYTKSLNLFDEIANTDDFSEKKSIKALTNVKLAKALHFRNKNGDRQAAKILLNEAKIDFTNSYGEIHANILEVDHILGEIAIEEQDYITALKTIDNRLKYTIALYGEDSKKIEHIRRAGQLICMDPEVLQFFLKRDLNDVEDLVWHYDQIGMIYFTRVDVVMSDPNLANSLMKDTNTSVLDYNLMLKWLLNQAKLYFVKSNNLEMLEIIESVKYYNPWLR